MKGAAALAILLIPNAINANHINLVVHGKAFISFVLEPHAAGLIFLDDHKTIINTGYSADHNDIV